MNKYQHIKTLIINGISVNVLDLVSRIVGKISELVDDISITACIPLAKNQESKTSFKCTATPIKNVNITRIIRIVDVNNLPILNDNLSIHDNFLSLAASYTNAFILLSVLI
jgi:hypothetical protein